MKTDLDTVIQRIELLETQNQRLRLFTFRVWPACFAIITLLVLLTGRIDLALLALLAWIGWITKSLVIILIVLLACGFVLKLVTDFKNRNTRFFPNPGSRPPTGEGNFTTEQSGNSKRR